MKAIVLNQSNSTLETTEVPTPALSDSTILINIKSAALNHHELWSLQENKLRSDENIIMGSDGVGIVVRIGADVSGLNIGDEVILNPSLYWGPNDKVHGPDYQILGFPTQGTFAEYISISSEYVYAKPKHLSLEEAAALPLAGLTAYRALFTRGGCVRDSKVLITGIGGGAALFALHFAVASGAQAYVTSSSHEKIRKAVDLGANGGVNYRNTDWDQELRTLCDGFDVIVDSAAGKGFAKLLDLAQPGASIAMFGRTAGNMENLSPSSIFWKQLSIHGTTMGTAEEFEAMLSLVSSKKLFPVIDSVYPARDIGLAFEKMEKAEQFGKIVINMEEL